MDLARRFLCSSGDRAIVTLRFSDRQDFLPYALQFFYLYYPT